MPVVGFGVAIPILDQGLGVASFLAFSEVLASASDNSRSVFCLAPADDGVGSVLRFMWVCPLCLSFGSRGTLIWILG